MSHGTVHDNNPFQKYAAGIMEIRLHEKPALRDGIDRSKRHVYGYGDFRDTIKRTLPKYLPYIGSPNLQPDADIPVLPNPTEYYLVKVPKPGTDPTGIIWKTTPTIGVFELNP